MKHSFFKVNILYELEGEISDFWISFRFKNKNFVVPFWFNPAEPTVENKQEQDDFPPKRL